MIFSAEWNLRLFVPCNSRKAIDDDFVMKIFAICNMLSLV